ncbi:alpha-amylase family protein [Pedobacter sp. PWIIR3]
MYKIRVVAWNVILITCFVLAQQACANATIKRLNSYVIPFGKSSSIIYYTSLGTYDVKIGSQTIISSALSKVLNGGEFLKSTNYTSLKINKIAINDQFGQGKKYTVVLTKAGMPTMEQVFYTYGDRDYFFSEVILKGANLSSNKMSPVYSKKVNLYAKGDNRVLFVPFDNDTFIRYDAKSTANETDNTSSEVGAIYDNDSRKGLIVGSLEHTVWKTGVKTHGKMDQLEELDVFGGYVDQDVTRDKIGHGSVSGNMVKSPKVFVGYFADWRKGLSEYGKANRLQEPPYVFNWTKPVPFGWNSWGVIQEKLSYEKAIKVVDYFATALPKFRSGQTAYIDLDSFWDNFTGGMRGDFSKLKEFADHCKSKGLQPGVYWAPFTDWGFKSKNDREAEGSNYKFSEMWTKVKDGYHDFDGARALDPTHPGTLRRIDYIIDKLNACGFKMIKIDFLGHATAESSSFFDPSVKTGMQAYRVGMEYLVKRLDNKMLIYAAISPSLATGRYAHVRRIACDAWKTVKDTEYTLNSVNYGWWQTNVYNFIDADHVVFDNESEGSNNARLASALITGTLITGDDFSTNGPWTERSKSLLQNMDLLEIARDGKAFIPLDGNTGTRSGSIFLKRAGKYLYLALFNFSKDGMDYEIPLGRLGLTDKQYTATSLFTGSKVVIDQSFHYRIDGNNADILKLQL